MRLSGGEKAESGGRREGGIGDVLARDVRKESVNNLARFFAVRTAWAGGWSQSPQCLAWKVLSLVKMECATSLVLQSSWERWEHSEHFISGIN